MPSYVVEVEGTFYREYLVYAASQKEAEERVLEHAQDEYDPDRFNIAKSYSRKADKEDLAGIEALDDKDVIVAGIEETENAGISS